jgi:hypothetical protein
LIIQADHIKDGMILQEPILNNFGFVLMPAGSVMSTRHIKLLSTWNIKVVHVLSDEEIEEDVFSNELLENARIKVAERIKWDPRNELEEVIIEQAIFATARQIKNHVGHIDNDK